MLLFISGLYVIPYSAVQAEWIVNVKRSYYLGIMVMLAVIATVGRPASIDRRFHLLCGALALIYVGNALIRQDMPEEYGYCLLSIAFIWLFVCHVVHEQFPLERFMGYLRAGVAAINLLALFVLIRYLSGDGEIQRLVVTGFQGNRVNFSIWLWQIVFLNFFLSGHQRSHFFLALAASSVLLVLQVFSGGRIGLLATLVVMIYFTWHRMEGAGVRLAVLGYLLLLVWMSGMYSTIPNSSESNSVFRELYGSQRSVSYFEYADRLLSHRLSIMANAVAALDARDLLVGKGAGHFDVVVDGGTWMVHNVFLKMLGELGVGAMLPLVALVWLPFDAEYRRRYKGRDLHFMFLVGIAVSLLQPRFIVTGLSNCLVLWLCYALILKEAKSDAASTAGHERQRERRRAEVFYG